MRSPTMHPNRHRVQRQIVELAVGTIGDAPAVHRELSRPFWDRAAPELERIFDGFAGPEELLRLDRLEIDLGNIDGPGWQLEFRRKVIEELSRSLAELTPVSKPREAATGSESPAAESWRQFVFFLIHGRLPWWAPKPAGDWIDTLLKPSGTVAWNSLHEAVTSNLNARARLIHHAGDEFLDALITQWRGPRYAAIALGRWTPKALSPEARRRWRREFWSAVIDWFSAGGSGSPRGGPELVHRLLTLRHGHLSASGLGARAGAWPSRDAEAEVSVPTAHDEDLPAPWREWLVARGDESIRAVLPETQTDAGRLSPRAPVPSPAPERVSARDSGGRVIEDEAIYVEGAGAILLHPFFERLFREGGLLAERTFRHKLARDRAVTLTGLLTFGRADVSEYELVLPKAICGAPCEEPLELVELDEEDHAACDALLHAVLRHWTALRSSSPAWLRQQFLLREGKIERVDSGYLLTIERRAQDVLLTRLPWGCGVIALPWLAERIFVRWID